MTRMVASGHMEVEGKGKCHEGDNKDNKDDECNGLHDMCVEMMIPLGSTSLDLVDYIRLDCLWLYDFCKGQMLMSKMPLFSVVQMDESCGTCQLTQGHV